MDQVKVALAWLKEHHFWVLAVLVVGVVTGVWYTGSASLASQFRANESKIQSEFTAVNGLKNAPFKPNPDVNDGQLGEIKKIASEVLKVWTDLYDNQKTNVLIWPTEVGDRFVNAVKDLQFGDAIERRNRELYLNYIENTFPTLLEIVDAEPIENRAGGRRGGSAFIEDEASFSRGPQLDDDGEPLKTYLVQWDDQVELRERLDLPGTPSTIEIWVVQEDLWVYQTLLRAIAATNKETGATRSDRAAVQRIVELKVGLGAADNPTASRLDSPDSDAVVSRGGFGGFTEDYDEDYSSYSGGRGRGLDGSSDFGVGSTGDDAATALLTGRYLGPDDQPITNLPADFNFGREFKRLPVRLHLEMDTRWLTKLMWELANAPLQVEVEQVRFNPNGVSGSTRSRSRNSNSGTMAFDRRPTYGSVVLQGIVYLFNPPDATIAETEDASL